MKLNEFDYELPRGLIAQFPLEKRESSRLMVVDRTKKKIFHRTFVDLLEYFEPGDAVVLNNSKVIPARLWGEALEGAEAKLDNQKKKIEVLLLNKIEENTYSCLVKPSKKGKVGTALKFADGKASGEIIYNNRDGKTIRFQNIKDFDSLLKEIGQVPLPPYIKREPVELDKERYQTVYARDEGSVAAPTAGLHFTKDFLKTIEQKNIEIVYLTLHIGYATFKTVTSEDIENHNMSKEYFEITPLAVKNLNKVKQSGKKVTAVGTTSCRVLETTAQDGELKSQKSLTNLFIYPPYHFKFVDRLLTNFHLPKTTLLMLVAAFVGEHLWLKAYQEAIEKKYRFYSYGDCMLII